MSTRYHLAIRRADDDAILVLADGAMPGFRLDDAPPWPVLSPVVDRARADHGLDVVALRAAWVDDPRDGAATADRLYEAVLVGGTPPGGARWVAPGDLDRRASPLGDALGRGVLDPAGADRQPWYGPGWLGEMIAWIDERLAAVGRRRRGPVRQVRSWARSALLTVETDAGRMWAKQVPMTFAHEVAVTGLLADIDPGIVAPLVAADVATGRLLMEDVRGPILADEPGQPRAWLATVERLAELQRVLAQDVSTLQMAGVPAAGLSDLATRVPALLADDALLGVGQPWGLTADDRDRLAEASNALAAACVALGRTGIAPSLDHGDLSAGQVIVGEMGPVFLDWSDATITHPFLAAASFLGDPAGVPDGLVSDVEAAYLGGWGTAAAGDRDGAAALELARIVHPLHMTQQHADRVLPVLEQPWELAWTVPALLRTLLPRLASVPRILDR